MKAQQQQKRNEWMRAIGTLASAPGLVAILWEPKGEGATKTLGEDPVKLCTWQSTVLHAGGSYSFPKLVKR